MATLKQASANALAEPEARHRHQVLLVRWLTAWGYNVRAVRAFHGQPSKG